MDIELTRQQKWLERGYTPDQIENHLKFERYKSKLARERRKKNNETNKEIINKVKTDLLNITFRFPNKDITFIKITPSTDGLGFWFKAYTTYKDGSAGHERQFIYFSDYSKASVLEYLKF